MKLNGQKIVSKNIEVVVLPRGTGDNLIFKAQAVVDYTEFDKLCPRPSPPTKMKRGGEKIEDIHDPKFKRAILDYGRKRAAWIVLKSLEITPGLEWETVDLSNPDTWPNYEEELRQSGLAEMEMVRILNAVAAANALDDAKIEEARRNFLQAEAEAALESSSLQTEQSTTPSGAPAKD